jgi:hypothetical protein
VAAKVARWHNAEALAAHYAGFGLADPTSDRLTPALNFARLLTFSPSKPRRIVKGADPGGMEQGRHCDAGAAYRVCQLPEPTDCRAAAAERQARRQKRCAGGGGHLAHDRHHGTGKAAPVAFTQQELGWEPWIAAKPLADFRDDEVAILAKFGHTDSDYFRLLGRNLPVLEQRTLTDKGIFIRRGIAARRARAGRNGRQ